MKMISNVFYLLANFSLSIAGIILFVGRLNNPSDIPPGFLALFVGGLLFLFLHSVYEIMRKKTND